MDDIYRPLFELGSGAFGKAWVVQERDTDAKLVSKVIQIKGLSDRELERCVTEVTVLSRCKHTNIIRYIEAYVSSGALHIVMEYADGGDLKQKIEKQNGVFFSKKIILLWFQQVVSALDYIHSRKMLHRDLKPQNVFLTSCGTVKVGDFGIAKVLSSTGDLAMTRIGTPFYISPEIIQRKPYNSSSDMWAAGCLLYELCMLHVPFNALDLYALNAKIVQCQYPAVPSVFGPDICRLISVLLLVSPDERLTAKQVLIELSPLVTSSKQTISRIQKGQQRSRSLPRVKGQNDIEGQRLLNKSWQKVEIAMQGKDINSSDVKVLNENDRKNNIECNKEMNSKNRNNLNVKDTSVHRRNEADLGDEKQLADKSEINGQKYKEMNINCIGQNGCYGQQRSSRQDKEVCIVKDQEAVNRQRQSSLSSMDIQDSKVKSRTYSVKDSVLRKLSNASPILSATIRKQRFTLSVSDPDALNVRDQNVGTLSNEDNIVLDDVFDSPTISKAETPAMCEEPIRHSVESKTPQRDSKTPQRDSKTPKSTQMKSKDSSQPPNVSIRPRVDSQTYIIKPKEDDYGINNNNGLDVATNMNAVIIQALSVSKCNRPLCKKILLNEIMQQLGKERGITIVEQVKQLIIEDGQSYQTLVNMLTGSEIGLLPLIAMYCA